MGRAWNSVYADCELDIKFCWPTGKWLENVGGSGAGVLVLFFLHLLIKVLTNLAQMARILTSLGGLNFVGKWVEPSMSFLVSVVTARYLSRIWVQKSS